MLNALHETDKNSYVTILRALFSNPEMLNYDGSIDQEYFMPSKNIFNKETLETVLWSYHEDKVLIEAIEKHGVGNYFDMIVEFLPNWDSLELKKRTCILLGLLDIEDLVEYKGWKGNQADIEKEKLKNEQKNKKNLKKSTITFERETYDYVEEVKEEKSAQKSRKKTKRTKKLKDEDDYDEDEKDNSFKGNVTKYEAEFYVERKSKRNAKSEMKVAKMIEQEFTSEEDLDDEYE